MTNIKKYLTASFLLLTSNLSERGQLGDVRDILTFSKYSGHDGGFLGHQFRRAEQPHTL